MSGSIKSGRGLYRDLVNPSERTLTGTLKIIQSSSDLEWGSGQGNAW